ncbi:MAG: OmpH family outer membrane protein [Bacteroidota bacterium]|nr:OmpH family outer membrane protein [Bacteroidota bacterium]MDP3145890.1 OmpH family outer membrane protein [Bacteroidota bacterium]MDP3558524.1 OmpH family outer membrane protein [Bacteroidota bacterium]
MEPKFNIDRPKISDEEIKKHQNFEQLVKQFKQQSLNKAKHDKSWWKSKKVRYSAVIAGITVICTISYLTLFNNETKQNTKHEEITTQTLAQKKSPPTKKFINEPSQKLKVNYTSYKINNAKGGEIKHPSNSKIKVPKNTFVDKAGKDVIGDVIIEYREFHDAADIIASGIPMAYDSAGTKYNLESAGMFDIKGSQNGEPVFIKPNKKVEVELVSTSQENRFNQYYLDTISKNWEYLKKDDKLSSINTENNNSKKVNNNEINSKLQALKNQIDVVIPKKIDSVKIVYTKKVEALPKAKEPKKLNKPTPGRPTFFLEGSYKEFPELSAFDNVIFEVGPENKNYSKELHEITWSDVKVSEGPVKGKNYLLTLSYRNKVEKLIVYPTLNGADFEKAEKKYQKKFTEYEALVEKRKDDEKRLMAEMAAKQQVYLAELKKKEDEYQKERRLIEDRSRANDQKNLENSFSSLSNSVKAIRVFSISKFGIFNSDCPHGEPVGKTVAPIFVLNEKENFMVPDMIYVVDHNTKTVLNINAKDGFKINYNPLNSYSICVFKNNKLFICKKDLFKAIVDKGGNKFTITEISESADNLIDLKKALEII